KAGRRLALAYGKTADEQQSKVRYSRGIDTNFVITRNPDATRTIRKMLSQLSKLAKEQGLDEALLSEGENLLSRMPRLEAQRALRKEYQRLTSDSTSVDEFRRRRERIVAGMKLRRSDCQVFADKIL